MEGGENMPKRVAESGIPNIQDAKVEELSDAVRELVEASTKLVIKLAVCECKTKDCELMAVAKSIAKAIDKIQTITPSQ